MSSDTALLCPRCQQEVEPEQRSESQNEITVWRCDCGWSKLVAESGVIRRSEIVDAMVRRTK